MKKILCLVAMLAMLQGCVPALIIGAATHSASKSKSQRQFTSEFEKNNTEREKAGLQPLDFCTEAKSAGIKIKKCAGGEKNE